jgi:hypothetical protein
MHGNIFKRFAARFGPNRERELNLLRIVENTSWAEKYPNVPKPEPKLSVRLLAAQWSCNDLRAEQMPSLAADLLEAGHDSPALRRLAGEMRVACSADVEDLVGKMFREFCIPYPLTEIEAKLIVTRQIAREVIAGERDAVRAGTHLEMIIWHWNRLPDDLATLFALNDVMSWDDEYQRYLPVIAEQMLDAFARLATMTDEQIFSA